MPLAIAHSCRIGALYGFGEDKTHENTMFASLLGLLDIARLTTECERREGVASPDQYNQRLSLEFLVHLVGTHVLSCEADEMQLYHRTHRHTQMLVMRLRAVGHRLQSLGGDIAYLRKMRTEKNLYDDADGHPLFEGEPARRWDDTKLTVANLEQGMSIFHYIEALQTKDGLDKRDVHSPAFLLLLWTDISTVFAPLAGLTVDELVGECPDSMENLLHAYFDLAKRQGVLEAFTGASE